MHARAVWINDHGDRSLLSVHTDPARAAEVVAGLASVQADPGITYCYSPATGEPCETHRGRR